jgi:hypothetical protein
MNADWRNDMSATRFVVWHESLHLGQIAMLRSHHGLTPLVTLITARAAAALEPAVTTLLAPPSSQDS